MVKVVCCDNVHLQLWLHVSSVGMVAEFVIFLPFIVKIEDFTNPWCYAINLLFSKVKKYVFRN